MSTYRAGVIGLGWMGMLSDIAVGGRDNNYQVNDIDRPTPELDVHRGPYALDAHGQPHIPHSWAEVLAQHPNVQLVAGAERDATRLNAFGRRYGINALYSDAAQMLEDQSLDIVAIATNVKGRADLTCQAVECGAHAITAEKPIAHTLDEADRMVRTCADAGVPLLAGAVPLNHPAFDTVRVLIDDGAIGKVVSIEADVPHAQKQYWAYVLNTPPAWVTGFGDTARREAGSDEFRGQGMMVDGEGRPFHFRTGAPLLRVTGTSGEISFDEHGLNLQQDVDTAQGSQRIAMPWPEPELLGGYNAVYGLEELIDCLEGRRDEPKNSGRRMAMAMEVEIAMKMSSANGRRRVDLPLTDRTLGLHYDWFR